MSVAAKVIRSAKDPKVIDFIRLSTEKRLRYAWKKTIVSSPTLITELGQKFEFDDIMLDKKPKSPIPVRHKNLYVFTPDIICKIGQLKHSNAGILATLPIPAPVSVETFEPNKWLILDGIDDLGELGTIIRSAVAFDWEGVWLTHTCGDPFDPVCIRASQGAVFSLPYRVGSIHNAIKHARRFPNTSKYRVGEGEFVNGRLDMDGPNTIYKDTPICIMVQKCQKDTIRPNDFKTVSVGEVEHVDRMPIGISASSVMMALNNRYSNTDRIS